MLSPLLKSWGVSPGQKHQEKGEKKGRLGVACQSDPLAAPRCGAGTGTSPGADGLAGEWDEWSEGVL